MNVHHVITRISCIHFSRLVKVILFLLKIFRLYQNLSLALDIETQLDRGKPNLNYELLILQV